MNRGSLTPFKKGQKNRFLRFTVLWIVSALLLLLDGVSDGKRKESHIRSFLPSFDPVTVRQPPGSGSD